MKTKPDPIFQKIEAHRAAMAAANAPSDADVTAAQLKALARSCRQMCKTIPATYVGFTALLDYCATWEVQQEFAANGRLEGALYKTIKAYARPRRAAGPSAMTVDGIFIELLYRISATGKESNAADKAHVAARVAEQPLAEIERLERISNDASRKWADAVDAIRDTPAQTLAGLLIKAKLTFGERNAEGDYELDPDPGMIDSLLADLRRFAADAGSNTQQIEKLTWDAWCGKAKPPRGRKARRHPARKAA
jgi:hypothetical protein